MNAETTTPPEVLKTFNNLKEGTNATSADRRAATAAAMNVAAQHHAAIGVEQSQPNFFQRLIQRLLRR